MSYEKWADEFYSELIDKQVRDARREQMEEDCEVVFSYWQSMREQIAALNSANVIRRAFEEKKNGTE